MFRLSRLVFSVVLFSIGSMADSQELYVYTEPASNMPSHSISFKLTGKFPYDDVNKLHYQRYSPEIMFGLSSKWMLHFAGTFSDYYSSHVKPESVRSYLKYRFFSNDDVHQHFRMAAFAEASYSNAPFLYSEMSLEGDNSGVQGGFIATQLINKLALSATTSLTHAFRDQENHLAHLGHAQDMVNYSFSAGYLVFPRNYVNFNQPNLNVYFELLGGRAIGKDQYYIDVAPALQLIFGSKTKINFGARFQGGGNMSRIANTTYLISVEHILLNVWKH